LGVVFIGAQKQFFASAAALAKQWNMYVVTLSAATGARGLTITLISIFAVASSFYKLFCK
jgi:hypothetical protein